MIDESAQLRHLRSLRNDPVAQAECALTLIRDATPKGGRPGSGRGKRQGASKREITQAALRVLVAVADEVLLPDAREALLALYAHYASHSETKDPGAYVRSAILRALRPSLHPTDAAMLIRAVTTYEFLPEEEAVPLRATAIVALNEVDDQLARFHAARLLGDQYVERMSGEPALSAARVLGVQGEVLALYFYVTQYGANSLPEVVAESLRHLVTLPQSLLPGLVERYRESSHNIILVGLFDLLLEHEDGPHEQDFLLGFLTKTEEYDTYQYLLTTLVSRIASGRPAFLDELLETVQAERDPEKALIAYNAFSILAYDERIASLLETLEARF